jgi:hypothetical protein
MKTYGIVGFTPGKRAFGVSIGLELGWTPEPVWTIRRTENFLPCRDSNSDPSVVQPVASRYAGGVTDIL